MIDYIRGTIESLNPAAVVLDTPSGLGYILNISLYSFSALGGKKEAKVYVHQIIREDAHLLYGFTDPRERELFRSLISVSGVGAATALIALSSLGPSELSTVISSGDVKRLKSIKGIGAKTAERIIVDLRDKISGVTLPGVDIQHAVATPRSENFEEAAAALTILGFDRKSIDKVLDVIFRTTPDIAVEDAIKQALPKL